MPTGTFATRLDASAALVDLFAPAPALALGLSVRDRFASPDVMHALFGCPPQTLDSVFDGLDDFIDRHFEPGALLRRVHR